VDHCRPSSGRRADHPDRGDDAEPPSTSGNAATDHLSRIDNLIEPRLVDVPGPKCGFFQAQVVLVRRMAIADALS
jgi:hypothetical protein